MSRPRVLALLPFLYKGALSIEVFRAMASRDIDVAVAYCEDIAAKSPVDDMADFRANDNLLDLTRLSAPERRTTVGNFLAERNIDLIVQVGAFDLYHHLPRWKEERPGLKIVDILYNEVGHTHNHFLYEACIDAVLVESESMADYVRRASAKPEPYIELALSGVDLQAFAPTAQAPSPHRPLTLGFLGRISSEKNPLGFVELAERLLARHPTLPLAFQMYGVGPDADVLRARLQTSAHAASIRYGGFVEDSRTALREFDALILPSRLDGRPVVIMEANGCGLPVLGAPVGGVPELIADGVNGYLMQPEDIDAFSALIARWSTDASQRDRLCASTRAYAVQHFDNQRMFDDYAKAFRRIIAG